MNRQGGLVTPADVELHLAELNDDLDDATAALIAAEKAYFAAEVAAQVALATARVQIGASAAQRGEKKTVQEKEDEALLRCVDEVTALATAEGAVRAYRANVRRILTQVDITRSLGASVRSQMELS